jgi:hypothetical protein
MSDRFSIADDTKLCSLIERLDATFDRLVKLRKRIRNFDKRFVLNPDNINPLPPTYYAVKEAAEYLVELRNKRRRSRG